MGSVVIGELQAVADVGWLWAGAGKKKSKERKKFQSMQKTGDGRGLRAAGITDAGGCADRNLQATSRLAGGGGRVMRVTGKRLGERAEAEFLAKAAGMGFGVAKPWGDSDRYDFILDVKGKLLRVQVKSAHRMGEDGMYSFRAHDHSLRAYAARDIDVLVAYVAPEKAWYVFPAKVFAKTRSLKLYPGSRRQRSKFEEYREAWRTLM